MPIISISRQLGVGGDYIGVKVAERLGCAYIDKEKIIDLANQRGILMPELELLDEKKPSLFNRIFRDRLSIYFHLLQSVIYDYARKGNVVIVGRGGMILLKDVPGTLKIKLISGHQERVERIMEREHLGRELAEELIRESDKNRSGYIRYIFNADWMDPLLYDMVINTSHLDLDTTAEMVIQAICSPQLEQKREEAHRILEELALAKRVEVALMVAKDIDSRYISVTATTERRIILRGTVSLDSEREAAEVVARNLEDVSAVENLISVTVIPIGQMEPM